MYSDSFLFWLTLSRPGHARADHPPSAQRKESGCGNTSEVVKRSTQHPSTVCSRKLPKQKIFFLLPPVDNKIYQLLQCSLLPCTYSILSLSLSLSLSQTTYFQNSTSMIIASRSKSSSHNKTHLICAPTGPAQAHPCVNATMPVMFASSSLLPSTKLIVSSYGTAVYACQQMQTRVRHQQTTAYRPHLRLAQGIGASFQPTCFLSPSSGRS